MTTVADLLLARAQDDSPGLRFEDERWSWREVVNECSARAAWLRSLGPRVHLGVLSDNVPELVFLLGGAALSGSVIVALNTTRDAEELAGDAERADCAFLWAEPHFAAVAERVLPGRQVAFAEQTDADARPAESGVDDESLLMLIFTSGTSGQPRAVRITHRKVTIPGESLAASLVKAHDVVYCPMPLFHSGAIMAAFAPALVAGAELVLRRRFSASRLVPDVVAYGCTYLHYVGKALSYVLTAEPLPRETPLKIAFGNEAAPLEQKAFGERFGCFVIDAYGSTETAITFSPDPFGPQGALGKLTEGIKVLDPATGEECPPGVTGELVNTTGLGLFDGYHNEKADDRLRDGMFWSGDHAYRDENDYVFFVGRSLDRLRVDGENFGAVQVERALSDLPGVQQLAVYGVPDIAAGDQVMAALIGEFDPLGFAEFVRRLPPKWVPRYVRVTEALPLTASNKILKRSLAAQAWLADDPIWFRPGRDLHYQLMTPADVAGLRADFARTGRRHLLPEG